MAPHYKNLSLSLFASLALCALTGCADTDDLNKNANGTSMMPMDENKTPGCTNTCLDGETQCLNELFVLTCEVQANGCRAFGKNAKRCGAGQMCNVSTSKCEQDDTKPEECASNCESGDPPKCNARGEVEACALRDGMECFTYEVSMMCSGGNVCLKGSCEAPVCNEPPCTVGATQCEGDLVQTCGMNNGCAVFGAAKDCADGKVCMGGSCQEKSTCEDECIVDVDKLCAPGGVPRVCGASAEGCGEYSDLAACGSGEVCEKGDCVTAVSCPSDACEAPGARDCSPGGQVLECVKPPGSDCAAWSVVEDCAGNGFICNSASAMVQCEPPPMMSSSVVINEVFYNVPGPDVDATTMQSKSFIELRGAPGQSLANWQIKLVNGNGGMSYQTLTLPSDATIGSNGYALLTTNRPSGYLNVLVFLGVNIYDIIAATSTDDGIQNGPDNVELYDASGAKVDALGYGDFTATDTFTGEGTSPGRIFENRSLGRYKGAPDTNNNAMDFVSLYPTPGDHNGDITINEIYVDQPGTDGQFNQMETFIELRAPVADSSWVDMELDQYSFRGIKGLDGMDYIFSGAIPGVDFTGSRIHDAILITGNVSAEGLVIICNIDASPSVIDKCSVPYEGADFRNGPDNFVLEYQGRPIDAVAYGTFSGSNTNVGEGSPVPLSPSSAGKSLNRTNDGTKDADTQNNAMDFYLASPSPARKNNRP